jgi:hypothetical protein
VTPDILTISIHQPTSILRQMPKGLRKAGIRLEEKDQEKDKDIA